MRNRSFGAVLLVIVVFTAMRLNYWKPGQPSPGNVLTWDAFGYYLDLPGVFIYRDIAKLAWLPGVLEKYQPTGNLYQVSELPSGNRVMKYLLGLSILYAPFFFLGHLAAGWSGFPQDGFSAPYAAAVAFGALVYALLGLLLLRRVLLQYFPERVTALTLLLLGLATNYPEYAAVGSGMTHGFLFSVYALLLWLIIRWHTQPTRWLAFFIGLTIGLACITRPTEGVMLFLALLWQGDGLRKGTLFRQQPAQLGWALTGGFLGILPQLVYWKIVTGGWIYDVGSKFLFFRPHWQVLFGWEKGWFVYTPITILMAAGLFLLRRYPFRNAVITFSLLNVWIVLAWADWRYGASYSCRALVQSYPVWALAFAAALQKILDSRLKYAFLGLSGFLIYLNLFQIWQYHQTILHYDDMNRRYYQAIFLKAHPSPLDMSLLDTDEIIRDESAYQLVAAFSVDSTLVLNKNTRSKAVLLDRALNQLEGYRAGRGQLLHLRAEVQSAWGAFDTHLVTTLTLGGQQKRRACRMENGISVPQAWNTVEYYFRLPDAFAGGQLTVSAETNAGEDIYIRGVRIMLLERR